VRQVTLRIALRWVFHGKLYLLNLVNNSAGVCELIKPKLQSFSSWSFNVIHYSYYVYMQSPLYDVGAAAGSSDEEDKLDASALLQRLSAHDDDDDVVYVSADQVHLPVPTLTQSVAFIPPNLESKSGANFPPVLSSGPPNFSKEKYC